MMIVVVATMMMAGRGIRRRRKQHRQAKHNGLLHASILPYFRLTARGFLMKNQGSNI
jgi:hypothetical protein